MTVVVEVAIYTIAGRECVTIVTCGQGYSQRGDLPSKIEQLYLSQIDSTPTKTIALIIVIPDYADVTWTNSRRCCGAHRWGNGR
jgi:hypothetical protein